MSNEKNDEAAPNASAEPSETEAATGVCNRCWCACDCCIDRVRGKLVPACLSSCAAPSDMGRAISWLQKWVYNGDDGPNLNVVLAAEFAEVRRETIEACAQVCLALRTSATSVAAEQIRALAAQSSPQAGPVKP